MNDSLNEWKSKFFLQTQDEEEFCLICQSICPGQLPQINIWNNHLLSEEHLETLYNQLFSKVGVCDNQKFINSEQIDGVKIFDFQYAKELYKQSNLKLIEYFQVNILQLSAIKKKEGLTQHLYCNILKRFFHFIFQKSKDYYEQDDLINFLQKEQFKQESQSAIQILNISLCKQMTLRAKQQIQQKISSHNGDKKQTALIFVEQSSKLIKILISDHKLRHALLIYLLFEIEIDINDIPHLKFDNISQGVFKLNYYRNSKKINKIISISDKIKLLCFAIIKSLDLKEQSFKVDEVKSIRDIQSMLDQLKKEYQLSNKYTNDQTFLDFVKKFKLSHIKKNKKIYEAQQKIVQFDKETACSIKFINLYLLFQALLQDYINQMQTSMQKPKLQSEIDLIRNKNILKIEKAYDKIVNIEEEIYQDNQIPHLRTNEIMKIQNQNLSSTQPQTKIIEQFNLQQQSNQE